MSIDQVSQMLDILEVSTAVSGAFAARGSWMTRTKVNAEIKFMTVIRGRAVLDTDDLNEPITLLPGDVAVLNGQTWMELRGSTAAENPTWIEPPAGSDIDPDDLSTPGTDVIIGGYVQLGPEGHGFLARTLAPVSHVRADAANGPRIRAHIEHLLEEICAERLGSDFALRQHAQLLLLDVIRAFADDPELPAGWLKAYADPQLRPAMSVIHGQVAKPWTLDDLARACAMSRTSFTDRFRAVAGTPPAAYLIQWRMLLAKRALRSSETRIGALAGELGYTSESAFSTAFKKQEGISPSRYRAQARQPA